MKTGHASVSLKECKLEEDTILKYKDLLRDINMGDVKRRSTMSEVANDELQLIHEFYAKNPF